MKIKVMKKWVHLTIKRSYPFVLFLNFKYHLLCVILKVNGLSFKIVCLSYNPLNYFYQSQTLKSSTRRTYDEPLSILYKLLHRAPRCIHILASYRRHSRFSSLAWYMDHLKQLTLVFAVIIGLRERRKW